MPLFFFTGLSTIKQIRKEIEWFKTHCTLSQIHRGTNLTCRVKLVNIQKEVGPTMVGDEHSDLALMNYLGATKRNMLGNHFWEYYVNDAPRTVLDKLENYGYRVVSMTGVGQTLVWCLHKEDNNVPPGRDVNVDPVKLQPRSELPQ
ncbi:GTP cyclohydrolase 1 feedback regulatory protein isoform X1 [Alligator sinensis]|uniref:GTP cyclohydrolase 1 feedback regulatory protein n=1 Tax=Alligator sinensis TaxID=38654 RepID=A0A3Q0GMT2_ALLSI|nr:GTP cyclohydrolase 1 feedback regulatory protein isoform X1 [Alligator sinensis]